MVTQHDKTHVMGDAVLRVKIIAIKGQGALTQYLNFHIHILKM